MKSSAKDSTLSNATLHMLEARRLEPHFGNKILLVGHDLLNSAHALTLQTCLEWLSLSRQHSTPLIDGMSTKHPSPEEQVCV